MKRSLDTIDLTGAVDEEKAVVEPVTRNVFVIYAFDDYDGSDHVSCLIEHRPRSEEKGKAFFNALVALYKDKTPFQTDKTLGQALFEVLARMIKAQAPEDILALPGQLTDKYKAELEPLLGPITANLDAADTIKSICEFYGDGESEGKPTWACKRSRTLLLQYSMEETSDSLKRFTQDKRPRTD
jgi:hypothetical protein